MAGICACPSSFKNTGRIAGKEPLQKTIVKLLVTQLIADDGTVNKITPTSLRPTYFQNLINNSDCSKRIYPIGRFENVTDERAEAIFETFPSGFKAFKRYGNRSFMGEIPNMAASYLRVIESMACKKIGFYGVDECGNLIGNEKVTGELHPIPIMPSTFIGAFTTATFETVSKVGIMFDVDNSMNDKNLAMIECSTIEEDLLSLEGLIEITAVDLTAAVVSSTTNVSVKLQTDYGAVGANRPVSGLAAKIGFYNIDQSTAYTFTTGIELAEEPGTYKFTAPDNILEGGNSFYLKFIDVDAKIGFSETLLNATIATVA